MTPSDDVAAANRFLHDFEPLTGVDYGWVVSLAKDRHALAMKSFAAMDDKATAVVNFVSGGAGLFTLGTLAALAGNKVRPEVIWSALPAMIAAFVAVLFATIARRPRGVVAPAGMAEAVRQAEHYPDPKQAEPKYFAHWPLCTALVEAQSANKGWWLWAAMIAVVVCIGMLFVPVLTVIVVGPPK